MRLALPRRRTCGPLSSSLGWPWEEGALNESEIREFLREDYPRLVNAMALICGSSPAAEDAVQEALGRAWELTERGRHIDSLPTWVVTVARNLLRDRFRRMMAERRARSRMLDIDPGPASGDPGTVERRADIARALAALPRRQREVAVFHYYLDLDVARIAALLRVPEGTVKSALHRARRSLAQSLHDEMEVDDVRG